MKTLETLQNEVDTFNEQHELYKPITADPARLARQLAKEVIEEQSEFVHFVLNDSEYEITFHQDHHGKWTAHLHEYLNEGD